jgi:hypothetical protein
MQLRCNKLFQVGESGDPWSKINALTTTGTTHG